MSLFLIYLCSENQSKLVGNIVRFDPQHYQYIVELSVGSIAILFDNIPAELNLTLSDDSPVFVSLSSLFLGVSNHCLESKLHYCKRITMSLRTMNIAGFDDRESLICLHGKMGILIYFDKSTVNILVVHLFFKIHFIILL
jgi:hypothetical protein